MVNYSIYTFYLILVIAVRNSAESRVSLYININNRIASLCLWPWRHAQLGLGDSTKTVLVNLLQCTPNLTFALPTRGLSSNVKTARIHINNLKYKYFKHCMNGNLGNSVINFCLATFLLLARLLNNCFFYLQHSFTVNHWTVYYCTSVDLLAFF